MNDGLATDRRPLVFAGVEELFPYFQKATTYGNVVDQMIAGNPDELTNDELHQRGWPLIQEIFAQRSSDLLERWQAARHTKLGGSSLKDVVVAAHDGRIETLLLDPHRQHWGTYDPQSREVTTSSEASAENYDLCDLAAVRTLTADGRIAFLGQSADELGEDGTAAIYRFAAN